LVKIAKKINKRDLDPAFTGIIWISIPVILNVLSLFFYFTQGTSNDTEGEIYLYAAVITLPVLIMNYYILLHNEKSLKIIQYFDSLHLNKRICLIRIFIIIIYYIFSILLCLYLANYNRKLIGL
jgi:heme/copper-type cytochrome/quinol oxidase subunit 2